MWSFVAPVKLDSAAPVFSRNQIRNGLKTHIKKPVLRVLLNKRGLAPVVSDDWDKVIAKNLNTRICMCLVSKNSNASDEDDAFGYEGSQSEQVVPQNTDQTAEDKSQEIVGEDVDNEYDKKFLFGDEAARNIPPKWYLLQVTRGRERAVRDTLLSKAENTKILRGLLLDVVVPCTKKVVLSPRGIPKVRLEPVFSGYVLVKLILTDSAYRSIKETLFVVGFVSFGNKGKRKTMPEPLRDSEAEEILRKVESGVSRSDLKFSVGDKVQVQTSEAMAYGIISEIASSNESVKVVCLLDDSFSTLEAKIDSLQLISDEEFEAAVKEYLKLRKPKSRQRANKNNVSSESLVSVLGENNEKSDICEATSNASEIDVFIDDLEQEEKERQRKRASIDEEDLDAIVPVTGEANNLLADQLFLGDAPVGE